MDDLVFGWDGSTRMGQLGGGGPQALWGYQLYHAAAPRRVGLAAGRGPDLPDACTDWLREAGVLGGLVAHEGAATPRAWQVLEADGTRHEARTTAAPAAARAEDPESLRAAELAAAPPLQAPAAAPPAG